MIEKGLKLLISVLVVFFIISISFYEISVYLENQDLRVFRSQINSIVERIDYLYSSNMYASFEQASLNIPANQSVVFNNVTEQVELYGFFSENLSLGVDLVDYLEFGSGDYVLTLCFDCVTNKSYVVVFR